LEKNRHLQKLKELEECKTVLCEAYNNHLQNSSQTLIKDETK
jgi:hypothetical protein